jgi:tetratricopeptide (TPR) repeat protein
MDEWMLTWLAGVGEVLVSQAPSVAAALLAWAVESAPGGSHRHRWLAGWFANALYHIGENAAAEQVANRALEHAVDPGLLVDLHWTLALCRTAAGRPAEALAALGHALATPELSPRHRSRLLVLAARTHVMSAELRKARQDAADALTAAEEGDTWVMGWATHVLAMVASLQGDLAEALSLYGRALALTQGDPALSDLRLLLQINTAAMLSNLDRHEEAMAAADKACQLAGQIGTTIRLAQAHCLRAELLFATGNWDAALAEMAVVPESLKQATIACAELGIAAMIAFHRGDAITARKCLSAAASPAQRVGHRLIPPLALARSLDHEQAGTPPRALSTLTDWLDDSTEELGTRQDLLPDATRLAMLTGDLDTAKATANEAAQFAKESQTPYWQANALYCRGLIDQDASQLVGAAELYLRATRPFQRAIALEAAASVQAHAGIQEQVPVALADAAEIYTRLGATVHAARAKATAKVWQRSMDRR